MDKIFVFFVIALFTNHALGQGGETVEGEDLEDRYGFIRPDWFPGQNQRPGQNQFPGQNRFPGQGQRPGQNQRPGQRTTTPSPNNGQTTAATTGTTTISPEVRLCINACPVTSEYNPVCGTDNVTYTNPGRLNCAQLCGVPVVLMRTSPCPAPPQASDATTQQ